MQALLSALLLLLPAPQDTAADAPAAEEAPRGLRRNEPGAYEGYTLFSPLRSTDVYLVDMQGEVVHTWKTEYPPTGSVYLLDDGHLLRGGREPDNPTFRGGGLGGRLQLFDWDGELVWDYVLANEDQTLHHDVEPLPGGTILAIAWEYRFREDAIEAGRAPSAIDDGGMWPTVILELRPVPPDDAEVVWEWHVWDHLVQDHDAERSNYGSVADLVGKVDVNADHRHDRPISLEERRRLEEQLEEMRALGYVDDEDDGAASTAVGEGKGSVPDWLHVNAVDYHPELDLIALSTPQLNEVWIIDHGLDTEAARWDSGGRWGKGGDLLWRWGNPRVYGAGSEEDRRLFYQHDPTWVDDPDGGPPHLLIYNNGGGRPDGDYSSVIELELPFDPEHGFRREPGQPFGPAEPVWSYADPGTFYSGFISGAQRLPNGNTLICEGASGRVFEVTRDGRVVWEYANPFAGEADPGQGGGAPPVALFRATRYPPSHPALADRNL